MFSIGKTSGLPKSLIILVIETMRMTMNFSKIIQMYIFDGNLKGRIMCELSNWNGRIYKISRNELNKFSERNDSGFTGIYFCLE